MGLAVIINLNSQEDMHQVRDIKIAEIKTSDLNPRKTFDQTSIEELAQSIKENGLINAITLRKVKAEEGIKYEVICGERRYRAVKFLGEETIQAVVKELDDKQAFACMVIENLQRTDIDPMEEAAALKFLYSKGEVPIKEIAKIIGKSQSFVINRIQLNNTSEPFIALMRENIINLTHLQEISKLTREQQDTLLESCFQPAQIERWGFKSLTVDVIKEWIDEHVMCHISSARFDPADETYKACQSCIGCKFNTASKTALFKDKDNPRCMKMQLFRSKNQEAILRQAKDLGLPVVYAGTAEENKEIIKAAQEYLLYPQPLGKREYLVRPTHPGECSDPNDSKYKKRLANFERINSVFEDNINAGVVIKVFEISYNGILSGEAKYLFNLPADEIGHVDETDETKAEQLSMYKNELRAANEAKQVERIERQRAFIESSQYTTKETSIDATEENVFLALLVSRLPQDFRKTVGLDYESAIDITSAFDKLNAQKNVIMREFIRTSLSDKSVSYSPAFATLLDVVLRQNFGSDVEAIDQQLTADYEKKCQDYEARIKALESELQSKRDTVSVVIPEETTAETYSKESSVGAVELVAEPTPQEAVVV